MHYIIVHNVWPKTHLRLFCHYSYEWQLVQVGATPDLMVAYIDYFLGGDEKRLDMVTSIQKRFPMCISFGGDGSYMSPYNLYSDTLLTNLLGQVSGSKLFSISIYSFEYSCLT